MEKSEALVELVENKGRTIILLEGGGGGMKNIKKKMVAGPEKTK